MSVAWLAIILYIIFTVIIGWRTSRKRVDDSEYWTAGRNLGPWSVGLSLSAGFMSISWSCVYAVQIFYWYGVGGVWLITIPWIISLGMIYYLSRRYRNLSAFSQPEMVGEKFGSSSRKMLALALAFVFLVWGGAEIYVAASLLAPQLSITTNQAILMIGLVVGFYMTIGGFKAVVATDKLQYALVAVYILIIAWLGVKGLSASGREFPDLTTTGARTEVSWGNLISPGWAIIILTLVAYLPGWVFEADLWLRVQAARDVKAARTGVIIGMVNGFLFVGIIPLFIGIAALQLYPVSGGIIPPNIGYEGDAIFSALVRDFAPAWLTLIITLGLVAAAMSTIDTCLNVMGLSIAYDFMHSGNPNTTRKQSKVVTVGTVILAMAYAAEINSLWDIFYLSSGILTTAVAFPIAAVFMKNVNERSVLLSSSFGFAGTVVTYFMESRGMLNFIEPEWLVNSYLGFILWGILFAILGYLLGRRSTRINIKTAA